MGKYSPDAALIARVEAQCAKQGIPVKINDPAVLRYIANIVTSPKRDQCDLDRSDSRQAGPEES